MKALIKYLFLAIGLFWLFNQDLYAQEGGNVTQDTASFERKVKKACYPCGGCFFNTKFLLNFDSRQSFVFNQLTKMNGLKVGAELHDKYRFGFGFYKLDNRVSLEPNAFENDTLFYKVGFRYNTLFFEYVIYQDYKWEISAPVSFGSGVASLQTTSSSGEIDTIAETPKIPLMSVNVAGHYKVFHWVGVGVGLGYRKMLVKNEVVNDALSSPFYVIKIKLFVGEVFKAIFNPGKVKREKEAYKKQKAEKREKRRLKNEQ